MVTSDDAECLNSNIPESEKDRNKGGIGLRYEEIKYKLQ
jgi:hypothetical protein